VSVRIELRPVAESVQVKPFLFDSDLPGFSEDAAPSSSLLPYAAMELTPVVATSFSPRALNMSSLQPLLDSDGAILRVVSFDPFPFTLEGNIQHGLDDLDVRVGSKETVANALRARPLGSAYRSNPSELWVVAGFDVGEPESESAEQPAKPSSKVEGSDADSKASGARKRRGPAESVGAAAATEAGNGTSGAGSKPAAALATGAKRPWLYSFRRFVPISLKAGNTNGAD
jgi:hypothetical protein